MIRNLFSNIIFFIILICSTANSFSNIYQPATPAKKIIFQENKGQWEDHILYRTDIPSGALFMESSYLTYVLLDSEALKNMHPRRGDTDGKISAHAYKVHFKGANKKPYVFGTEAAETYFNYFTGNDQEKWATDVKGYYKVTYAGLYPDIDMQIYSQEVTMKYDFIVKPGGDASAIRMEYDGANAVVVDKKNLRIKTSVGDVIEQKPYAYQLINGEKTEVPCYFSVKKNIVSFRFPDGYDKTFPLIVDPQLIFSTYSGSTADNWGFTATYDLDGNLYAGGIVFNTGYPTTSGAYQASFQGEYDMGISKFSADGANLIYSTYIGGSNSDQPHSLITNANGELYIYGRSNSSDFPVNGFQTSNQGGWDIVIFKLSSTGTQRLGSTYIGGSGDDGVNISASYSTITGLKHNYADDARGGISLDVNDNCYIASSTQSSNFPATNGAYRTSFQGGSQDACIFKLNSNLSSLLWATYLGGNLSDAAYALEVDNNNRVYVTGGTYSTDFPTTGGAINTSKPGGVDGFVSILSSQGSNLISSTYIGTSSYDQSYFIQLDSDNEVYIFGQTQGNYPTSNTSYEDANSGQFIHKLSNDLTSTVYSTVFGTGENKPNLSPTAFLVDVCEKVYISGWGGGYISLNPNNYYTANMQVTSGSSCDSTGKFYVAVFEKDMSSLLYARCFGGTLSHEHVDGGTSRFDKNGIIYHSVCASCSGYTNQTDGGFPTTSGVWSETNESPNCNLGAFKIDVEMSGTVANFTNDLPGNFGCVPLTVDFENKGNGSSFFWDFDDGSTSTDEDPSHTFTDTGTYIVMFVATNTSNCNPRDTSYATITVSDDSMSANFDYLPKEGCSPLTVNFTNTSSGASSYRWYFGDGGTSTQVNPSHTYTEGGSFTVTLITYNGSKCNNPDTATTTVQVISSAEAEIDADPDGCVPYTVDFRNTSKGKSRYFWYFGDGDSSIAISPTHTFTDTGTYRVMLIAQDTVCSGTIDTVYFTINVHENPIGNFYYSPEKIAPFTDVYFTDSSINAVEYSWKFGDGDSSSEIDPVHQYKLPGLYESCETVISEYSCRDTVCDTVEVLDLRLADLPTAFSPNGDGVNDILYVRGWGIAEINLTIYNRWGQKVFESEDIKEGWDGTINNKPQDMDTYVYLLGVVFYDGEVFEKHGNITLVR